MTEFLPFLELLFVDLTEWVLALSIRLGGYQPHYFPRLHYYARVLNSDVFPIADYVQFVRRHAFPQANGTTINGPSYQAHTPIRTRHGTQLLGVCLKQEGRKPIHEVKISYDEAWQDKHLRVIKEHYRPAPYFDDVYPQLEHLLRERRETLADLNVATFFWGLGRMLELAWEDRAWVLEEIHRGLAHSPFRLRRIERLSDTSIPVSEKGNGRDANDWLIDVCRAYGADEYYFGGTSAASYMDFDRFRAAGIALKKQEWFCVSYPQLHGESFVPNLSIIDLLMNVHPGEARAILASTE